VVAGPFREFWAIRVQVQPDRAWHLGGQVGDEPPGVGGARGDDRAHHRDRAVAPGRRVAGDPPLGLDDPDALGERGQPAQQVATVGAESRFVDIEDRRHVGRRGRPGGLRHAARGAAPEPAGEGGAPADRAETERGVQRLSEVGGEQGDRGVPGRGEQMRHQRAAEPQAAVPPGDEHHAHRGQVRAVPGEHHRPGEAGVRAVRRVHAEGFGLLEQQRPLRLLRRPAPVDRKRDAVLVVFRGEPTDRRERCAVPVRQHAS
jgi:hypothetical protein